MAIKKSKKTKKKFAAAKKYTAPKIAPATPSMAAQTMAKSPFFGKGGK